MSTHSFQIEVPDTVIARARRGEVAAFEQIYRAFERPAYTLALRLTADAELARDVVHDAMLRVFDRVRQFRGDAPFWGWLRQIVLNEALMRLRRGRALTFEDVPDDESLPSDAPAPWLHADAHLLEGALARLPAMTRSVIWLYHVEGYTHVEIAELTGMTTSFSKSQLARGTSRLRRLLQPTAEVAPCLTVPA